MKQIFILFILLITFTSCEKLLSPDPVGTTHTEVFESLWSTLDEGYVHFAYKGIDWDSIHDVYKDKIVDTMEERDFYDTCVSLIKVLNDPTVKIKTSFAEFSVADTSTYKPNFNRYLLERNYWKNYEKTGPFIHRVIDSIGYVYYEDFDEEVTNAQLDIIIEKLRLENDSIEGVVFDVRDNKGGDIKNLFTLMRRMGIDTTFTLTTVMYKTFYKNGPEKDDISDAQTSFIEQIEKTKFPKQFVLLTNRRTRGIAALFSTAAKGYKNVVTMGDRTGPATGRIVGAELSNGWQIEYPASYFTSDDDLPLEQGVEPDINVEMLDDDEAKGIDTILEEAFKQIKNR